MNAVLETLIWTLHISSANTEHIFCTNYHARPRDACPWGVHSLGAVRQWGIMKETRDIARQTSWKRSMKTSPGTFAGVGQAWGGNVVPSRTCLLQASITWKQLLPLAPLPEGASTSMKTACWEVGQGSRKAKADIPASQVDEAQQVLEGHGTLSQMICF